MLFPYKLIDLTHTLNDAIPSWDDSCGFHHDVILDYSNSDDEYQFRVMKIRMFAGIGTHMDAPSHCVPGAKNIDDFDLNDLCMPAYVIDVTNQAHKRYSVSLNDIDEFELQHGNIQSGSCVMIKTGWERFWDSPLDYRNDHIFPSVSLAAAEALVARGVRALGIDTLSPDRPEDGYPVHRAFLANNGLILENVAQLELLPPIGAMIMALPIKIEAGTEAPIRLVGLIPSSQIE